jgi:hypothetical protein
MALSESEKSALILKQIAAVGELLDTKSAAVYDTYIIPVYLPLNTNVNEVMGWAVNNMMYGRGFGQRARFSIADGQYVCQWS